MDRAGLTGPPGGAGRDAGYRRRALHTDERQRRQSPPGYRLRAVRAVTLAGHAPYRRYEWTACARARVGCWNARARAWRVATSSGAASRGNIYQRPTQLPPPSRRVCPMRGVNDGGCLRANRECASPWMRGVLDLLYARKRAPWRTVPSFTTGLSSPIKKTLELGARFVFLER